MSTQPQHINQTKNKPPRRLLVQVLKIIENKNTALDNGSSHPQWQKTQEYGELPRE